MLLPSVNVVAEGEVAAMMPDGVSLHTTRLKLTGGRPDDLLRMADEAERGAELLADANVDLIVFHCTAVTTYDVILEQQIKARIQKASGKPATTTAEGLIAAFRALPASRIVLVSPYPKEINDREVAFLRRHEITVLSETGLNLADADALVSVEPGHWYRLVKQKQDDTADAYFISCTAIRTAAVIDALERDTGKPVLTSNQAMIWHALRLTGIADRTAGFGELFARH